MGEVLFSKEFDKLLESIDFSKLGKKIAIKCHFGEEGCTTFIPPSIVKKLYDKVKTKSNTVDLVDCNVLYKGARTTKTEHLKTAKEHGFTFAPVKILDGEYGQDVAEINNSKIGKGIKDYDSIIVLTHFKGHMETGFGGALKNIGMGLASRAGKLYLHGDTAKPSVNKSKCIGCGVCISECPVECIKLKDEKAEIVQEDCIGCAMCIAVCPVCAIKIPWAGSTPFKVQEKICDYTKNVLSLFGKNTVFINCLINITTNCDCMSTKQEPVIEDIGFLYSKDLISLESASKELVTKKAMKLKGVLFNHMLDYAEKTGLGKKEYKILEIK
ncbi:MAG: DUF362 domain-containing protein [Nanoarchaeota archaeon]|nr:DUF362 domain-containing protein [Nanoarchaeota archaeon]